MKTRFLIMTISLFAHILAGCGNIFVGKKEQLPEPDRIVYVCNDVEYFSDKSFIRASGVGKSRNESTAMRMANLDASVNLARAVESYGQKIAAFKDKRQVNKGAAAVEWEDESLTREELNKTLSNVATICSQTQTEDEMFVSMVIVEIPIAEVMPELR
jgi:hypothetical protein